MKKKRERFFGKICKFALIASLLFVYNTADAQEEATRVAQASLAAIGTETIADILPPSKGMYEKVSLDLRNIEIVEALKFLALKSGINIIATRNVSGRTTLMVDGVTVKDIFDIMLRSNGLAYSKENDIYNIMTENEYKSIFGKNFSDIRKVKSFRLQYAIPEQAFNLIDTIKSSIGRVLVASDSGTVLIMDTPEKIALIERALSTLEQRNHIKVFNLKYANAKEIEAKIKAQLDGKGVGSIKADERSNQVIVQALPERMKQVEELITALDNRPLEVVIDAKIVKVKLSDETAAGVDWEGIGSRGDRIGMSYFGSAPFSVIQDATDSWLSRQDFLEQTMRGRIGAYPSSAYTTSFTGSKVKPGEEMHIGLLHPEADFDLLIKYLNTIGNTQILSNPRLSVVNNQEARIHVGERQAYVTTTTTTGQATSTVSEEITFLDVGIQLAVTPTISSDGYIMMKVKPEVSSKVSELITPSGNRIPIIDTSTAETTVLVKDGTTIIIGGLRREDITKTSDGVPFLKDIPILGFLFKTGSDRVERTELLVLITPHIVKGDELITGDERDFLPKGKDYRDYEPFLDYKVDTPYTKKDDIKMLAEVPSNRMKNYKEYSILTQEEIEKITR